MKNLSAVQTWELLLDLEASIKDIEVCEEALLQGITNYSGGSVSDRLEKNKGFVDVICEELKLRENNV